jgi:hypothetical protein
MKIKATECEVLQGIAIARRGTGEGDLVNTVINLRFS